MDDPARRGASPAASGRVATRRCPDAALSAICDRVVGWPASEDGGALGELDRGSVRTERFDQLSFYGAISLSRRPASPAGGLRG